ncbi:hypothetical protein GLYMA_08G166300v4 [Glycine max]|nr:hypothetical protein GLYMA_08G166300v4 [Glycine max]KAH1051587.1 hypothetical protein GYH30_021470 [Glycine max]
MFLLISSLHSCFFLFKLQPFSTLPVKLVQGYDTCKNT